MDEDEDKGELVEEWLHNPATMALRHKAEAEQNQALQLLIQMSEKSTDTNIVRQWAMLHAVSTKLNLLTNGDK